jgi:cell division protein FtsB
MPRPRRRVSHVKEIYYIASIVALVAATLFSIWGPGGYLEVKRAQAEVELRRGRVDDLRKGNQQRLENIQGLRSDPRTQEKYAREKGYGRSGELIQQLPLEPEPKRK